MTIIPKSLIYYRLHENQIGEQNKKEEKSADVDTGFSEKPNDEKKIIGIFCICTGNYINYLKQLIKGIQKHFLKNYTKVMFIATDNVEFVSKVCNYYEIKHCIHKIHKKGFPLDTLYRYKYILDFGIKPELLCDVLYYIDVDMKIVSDVGEEILPTIKKPLVATRHPGFATQNFNGSPETRKESTAYISEAEQIGIYVAGGFNGGITHHFRNMARNIHKNILIDKSKDIMAVWHDESHLNRYYVSNKDSFLLLTPSYCYPENFHIKLDKYPQKIVALSKDHDTIRNCFDKKQIYVNAVGGLGNLLFQVFYAYHIAKIFDLEVCIAADQKDEHRQGAYHYHILDNVLRVSKKPDDLYHITEIGKSYMNLLCDVPTNRNIFLNGYFQSPLYFKNNFLDICKNFMNFELLRIAKNIIGTDKFIAIHIRGGDYLRVMDYHYLQDEEYYTKVLSQTPSTYKRLLFTDDKNYVDQCFESLSYDILATDYIKERISNEHEYLIGNSELEMMLMSLCKIIVCANSTFSLWASYFSTLNDVEKVYLPNKWFSYKGPKNFFTDELALDERFHVI